MDLHYFFGWLTAFVWTCAIEIPIYALFFRPRFKSPWTAVGLAFGLQVVTHPTLWYAIPQFEPYETWLLVAETGVTTTEALLASVALHLADRSQPGRAVGVGALAAIVANVTTTYVGGWMNNWIYGL